MAHNFQEGRLYPESLQASTQAQEAKVAVGLKAALKLKKHMRVCRRQQPHPHPERAVSLLKKVMASHTSTWRQRMSFGWILQQIQAMAGMQLL